MVKKTGLAKRVENLLKQVKKTGPKKKAKKTAKASVRAAVRTITREQKYFDAAVAQAEATVSAPTVTHLDIIPTGAGVNNRIGKHYKVKNCHVRGHILAGTAGTVATYKISLIWDSAPNKAAPAYADIYSSTSPHNFMNKNNETRFVELHSWHDTVKGASGDSNALQRILLLDRKIDLSGKNLFASTTADDTTGVITNRISGALLMCVTSTAVTGTTAPLLLYNYRIEFDDM